MNRAAPSPADALALLPLTAAILAQTSARIFSKTAATLHGGEGLFSLLLNPWYAAALGMLVLQSVAWIATLRRTPLSRAYPAMSLSLVLTLVAAWALFDEDVTERHIAGMALIVVGVVLCGRRPANEATTAAEPDSTAGPT